MNSAPDPDPKYVVTYTTRARKDLSDLDRPIARRIINAVLQLAENPRPDGCRKLKGRADYWRIRIGDYRVLYKIDDGAVTVVATRIAHRSDVYRDLD